MNNFVSDGARLEEFHVYQMIPIDRKCYFFHGIQYFGHELSE